MCKGNFTTAPIIRIRTAAVRLIKIMCIAGSGLFCACILPHWYYFSSRIFLTKRCFKVMA